MNKFKQIIYIVLGSFIAAMAINLFFVENNITSGGASGVGILINYLFNVPVGMVIILINIPLFIISIIKFGYKFTSRAIIGTVLLSIFVDITADNAYISLFDFSNDLILSSVFGGLFMGIGLSLVFKGKASTGGSELLAQIIYKVKPIITVSQLMLILDAVIIIASGLIFKSLNSSLYSLIAIFVSKKTIDVVFEGVNYTKIVNIVTKKRKTITGRIIKEVERGVTSIKCVGEYTDTEYTKIECVVTMSQIYKIKEIVKQEDKEAFMYIASAVEVLGNGFK